MAYSEILERGSNFSRPFQPPSFLSIYPRSYPSPSSLRSTPQIQPEGLTLRERCLWHIWNPGKAHGVFLCPCFSRKNLIFCTMHCIRWCLHRYTSCHWLEAPSGPSTQWTWLQQVEEHMGQPISACQFVTLYRSLWRSLRSSAGQVQQWLSEWVSEWVYNTVWDFDIGGARAYCESAYDSVTFSDCHLYDCE